MKSVKIRFEGPEYYLYTLTSWLREIEDIIKDRTCIEHIEVEAKISQDVKIYVNDVEVFAGLPDAEWALAELIIHELYRQGYVCTE